MTEEIKAAKDAEKEIEVTENTNEGAVDIIIEDDPSSKEVEKVNKPDAEVTADEGIADLKRQLAEDKARIVAAERAKEESDRRATQAMRVAGDANAAMLDSEIERVKSAGESARKSYKDAMQMGDYDKAGEAQEAIADARFSMRELESHKKRGDSGVSEMRPPANDVEAIASTLPPKSAAWVRDHPEVVKSWDRVLAAHGSATTLDRIPVESPEYFSRVEELLGIKAVKKEAAPIEDRIEPIEKTRTSFQAPPSREVPSLRNGQLNKNVVRLSADERSIAAALDMSERDYAKQKLAAIASGELGSRH